MARVRDAYRLDLRTAHSTVLSASDTHRLCSRHALIRGIATEMPLAVPKGPLRTRVDYCPDGLAKSRAGRILIGYGYACLFGIPSMSKHDGRLAGTYLAALRVTMHLSTVAMTAIQLDAAGYHRFSGALIEPGA